MSALFSKPSVPTPAAQPAAAPTPVVDRDAVASEAGLNARRKRGRFSTMIAPSGGGSPNVGTPMAVGIA